MNLGVALSVETFAAHNRDDLVVSELTINEVLAREECSLPEGKGGAKNSQGFVLIVEKVFNEHKGEHMGHEQVLDAAAPAGWRLVGFVKLANHGGPL
ncbi:MAG TPA: hypothetical protein VNG12_13005 [Acidimicrobiales bacterium]|nr:hypothetical protein [Acidimicrobiales bacterium]